MSLAQGKKIISQGLQKIITQKLNADHNGYTGDAQEWEGVTELTITPTVASTVLPAGNDPQWMKINGNVTADVSLKLYDIPLEKMKDLLSVKYDAENGVSFEGGADAVFLGLKVDRPVTASDGSSTNRIVLYKVTFDLPEISMKTIEEEDTAVSDVTLSGKASPVFYSKSNGTVGNITMRMMNSVSHPDAFASFENGIVYPTDDTSGSSSNGSN